MKKRIISIMLVALISFSLTACGGSVAEEEKDSATASNKEQQAVENTEEVVQKAEEDKKAEEQKQAEIKAQEEKKKAEEKAKQEDKAKQEQSKPKAPVKPPVQQVPPVADKVPAGEQGVPAPIVPEIVQPTYTRSEMEAMVQRCIVYGKSLGMTFMEKATKDDSSWTAPSTTEMAYKGNVEGDIKEALNLLKKEDITHFGLQLEPVNSSLPPTVKQHWIVYDLMG